MYLSIEVEMEPETIVKIDGSVVSRVFSAEEGIFWITLNYFGKSMLSPVNMQSSGT